MSDDPVEWITIKSFDPYGPKKGGNNLLELPKIQNLSVSDKSITYCAECGTQNSIDQAFCHECGVKLEALIPAGG